MKSILYIFLLIFDATTVWARASIVQGVLDLSAIDKDSHESFKLEGEWGFYWKSLLTEADVRNGILLTKPTTYVASHGKNWLQVPEIGEKHGFGTYVLRINGLKDPGGTYAVQISQFFGTHRLALWHPARGIYRELGGKGQPGNSSASEYPAFGKTLGAIDFPCDGTELYILVQYSEYHVVGSYADAPLFGRTADFHLASRSALPLTYWILGLFTMLIMSNLCLYLLRRSDFPSLTIAALTLFNMLRFAATESIISQLLEPAPAWIYVVTIYTLAWTFPLSLAAYFSFLRYSFPKYFSKRMHLLGMIIIACYLTLTLTLDLSPIIGLFLAGILLIPLIVFMLIQQLRAVKHGVKGSGFAILGVWVLIGGLGHDLLVFFEILNPPFLSSFAMILFTLLQSLVVARNFTFAFQTAKRLSTHLKDEVRIQTAQLQEQNQILEVQKAEIARVNQLQKDWTEIVLHRFLPPQIAKEVAEGKVTLFEAPAAVEVTVVFADLCAFTRATEHLGAEVVGNILNQYFVTMTEIVFSEGGMVDKFIGDGIMAVFGVPRKISAGDQVKHSMRCAVRMQTALGRLNRDWEQQYQYTFSMRIGVHRGPAVFGSFGGRQRSDYTVIGSAVNIASRIEAVAAPDAIYFSSPIREYLDDRIVIEVGLHSLKGLDERVNLYQVNAQKSDELEDWFRKSA